MNYREDRRDSYEEKVQKRFIADICKKIKKNFPEVEVDLGDFYSISKGNGRNGKYFNSNGKITPVQIKRNHCKDSKAIDGVVYFKTKDCDYCLEIYFFCKATKGTGGDQDYIPFEIKVTKDCIEKNKNEHLSVVFMLEGDYWTKSILSDCDFDGKKTIYANKNNMEEILINILKTNKFI